MKFETLQTGDRYHASEGHYNAVSYGIFVVETKETLFSLPEAEHVLENFLTGLQAKFNIQHSTGITKETYWPAPRAVLVDYWQDATRTDWKVKGWTDGKTFAVLYIKNINDVSTAVEEQFLDGLVFAR